MYSQQLLDWVLEAGEDDEVQLADIAYFVKEDSGSTENLINRTVDTAVALIRNNVITPGDMLDYEFHPWPVESEEAERKIREGAARVSEDTGRFLPGDVCWFRASSYGE